MITPCIFTRRPHHTTAQRGDILVSVIVFSAVAVTVVIGLVNWGAALLSSTRNLESREQAFQIAEAGLDYYRWHLAQYPTDYTDGTTTPQPYVHPYYDKDGVLIGSYALTIVPPVTGSTVVNITSVGSLASSSISRTVQESLAIPSLAKFAVVANDNMTFGQGTTVYGPIQSNKGIHFDGVAYNSVSSALTTYTDPDSSSCTTSNSWAVHTCIATADPASPGAMIDHSSDVFRAGRQISVPGFPFSSLSGNLSTLLSITAPNGVCSTPGCWSASGAQGYYIHMNTNNTFDMYKVTALVNAPSGCSTNGSTQWGTWSVATKTVVGTYTVPSSGVIFVKDNIWVDGTINGTRVTIVAAADISNTNPDTYSNITVNNDLKYTHTDGTDSIGLFAQGDINVGLVSADSMEIDAALIAANGRVGRHYYSSSCSVSSIAYWHRTSLTLTGMIATALRYGFAYSGTGYTCADTTTRSSGYCIRIINYDANLLYSPPPSFPQATTQYQVIKWEQIN
ncbi:MAG: hypothetical protein WCG07_00255 [Candidatus Taylorbacteria bacterium]